MDAQIEIDKTLLKKAALQYRAVNHKLRQMILQRLHENGSMAVTALYSTMQLEQPVASQQLAILRRARLVTTERRGKTVVYSINYSMLDRISSLAGALLKAGNHPRNLDLQQPDAGKAGTE